MDQKIDDVRHQEAWKRDLVIRCGAAAYLVYKYMRRKMRQFQHQGWFRHSERHIGDFIGLKRAQTRAALEKLTHDGYLQRLKRVTPGGVSSWVVIEPEMVGVTASGEPTRATFEISN